MDQIFEVEANVPCVRLGSAYGGWVVTPPVSADAIVYSAGVGRDITFDLDLIDVFGVQVHAFDPTPESVAWVHAQELPPEFIMHAVGLASFDGTAKFSPPDNPAHVSHTMLHRPMAFRAAVEVPVKRLSTVMEELGHAHLDILKMDIEGAEYNVIADMLETGLLPRQLLVEFHHAFPEIGIERTHETISTLRKAGFKIFSVSPSNKEFSFVRENPR